MEGLTADFAQMSAHGEILIKPHPEIAEAGNTVGLISESPSVTDSSWTLLSCWREPLKRETLFLYRESVGDHPSYSESDTSLDGSKCIMLRGRRQIIGLNDKYSWISFAYVWILGKWFLTSLFQAPR